MNEARARAILADLLEQRRRLEHDAGAGDLRAANRLGIVYWREQLARAGAGRAGLDGPGYTGRRVRM